MRLYTGGIYNGKKKKKLVGTELLAWPTGVQPVFSFCSGVSKLFGAQGSPSSGGLLNL